VLVKLTLKRDIGLGLPQSLLPLAVARMGHCRDGSIAPPNIETILRVWSGEHGRPGRLPSRLSSILSTMTVLILRLGLGWCLLLVRLLLELVGGLGRLLIRGRRRRALSLWLGSCLLLLVSLLPLLPSLRCHILVKLKVVNRDIGNIGKVGYSRTERLAILVLVLVLVVVPSRARGVSTIRWRCLVVPSHVERVLHEHYVAQKRNSTLRRSLQIVSFKVARFVYSAVFVIALAAKTLVASLTGTARGRSFAVAGLLCGG